MCGIAGIISLDKQRGFSAGLLRQMCSLIRHRGPDDEGYLCASSLDDAPQGFGGFDSTEAVQARYPLLPEGSQLRMGLGFRRLAIVDLSAAGHQPMSDPASGLHIVFNGEIYNYKELRTELEDLGYHFDSHSDTEVILKSYAAWGKGCQSRFNGIWAFAIWDQHARELFCSRDRFGVKPFYFLSQNGLFAFGSEIKQLLPLLKTRTLNLSLLRRLMKINAMLNYRDETIWQEIRCLEPGQYLTLKDGAVHKDWHYQLDPQGFETSRLSFTEATEAYRELFLDSLKLQTRADVEVGSCLSGGLDSSAIVCGMAPLKDLPTQTFSAYFGSDPALDERRWIDLVVKQSGSVAHYISPTPEEAWQALYEGTWNNDLPLGAGCPAQDAVMKLASQTGIRVLLDGQGSDELTGGYRHAQYRFMADLLRRGKLSGLSSSLKAHSASKSALETASILVKTGMSALVPESLLYRLELKYLRFEPFNRRFGEHTGKIELSQIQDIKGSRLNSFLYNMIYSTSLQTLLHYEDRMAMRHSVESRVPFLDHRLVELALSLPSSYKIDPPGGKRIHRAAIGPLVPQEIFDRRDKSIFGTPFHRDWMRGPLRGEIDALLASKAFRSRGLWDLPQIMKQWHGYLDGKTTQAEMIFNVVALELWFRHFLPDEAIF
ncbi:MAG TPA: asparagine synthase (glutamine-hydrolyzing) [Candidatus Cloacimonadota bacterium]|nr:asparagine synthase (glutamine-hydrolyzing) [Candidatus Cloacimonadota bacterium]